MAIAFTPAEVATRKSIDLRSGDTVRVHQKIQEKGKTRIQIFEGLVIARKHGAENGATFTVRRATGGYGVEKVYPLFSPLIDKIEVVKRSQVRRAKLYHIRRKAAKEISKRMKMMAFQAGEELEPTPEGAEPMAKEEVVVVE